MSQNEMIIQYLKPPGRTLTRLSCFKKFGFMTLNSRASDIKKKGYPIQSELVRDKKTGKTYAKYFLR
jgi:hypothetical protein